MIPEIDTPTFPLRAFIIRERVKKNQGLPARPRWKNRKNVLAYKRSLAPPLPPPPRIPGVQFNSLPTDRRSLLYERLERATGGQNHCLGLGGVKC